MGTAFRILLIDDSPDDKALVRRELHREFPNLQIEDITDMASLEAVFKTGSFDATITDYKLAWASGFDILKKLKVRWPDRPVIMFTDTGSEKIAVRAMKIGLDDYVLKSPKHFLRLAISLKAALKRAEDERRSRNIEERYKQLFSNLPICVYRTSMNGQLQEMNPAGLQLFGFNPAIDLRQQKIDDLYVSSEDRKQFLSELMKAGQVSGWRVSLRRKDGTLFWAEIHATLIKDENGAPTCIDGVIEDISRLVKTEEELKKFVVTLNTLVEHMPEGVFLLNAEHRIALANPVAKEYLYAIAGAEVGDLLTHIKGLPVEEFLTSPQQLWHDIELVGNPSRKFEIAGQPVEVEDTPGGLVFVARDVTEERSLADRIQSQDRLAAVGQLAAGIAHDFNNILTSIIGYTEILLLSDGLPDKTRQKIEAILHNGQKAAELIRQVLDFSRKSISEMRPIDLLPFLKEFLIFIRRTIPENINISLNCEPGQYSIKADPTKLHQVLTNLAVNARDAMPKGGAIAFGIETINVRPKKKSPFPNMSPGEWISLTVSDTGMGIPHESLPHIFEPFFTTKEVGKGTGLGLSQVYGIVKQHDGFIDVRSQKGSGSSFIVYLPAIKVKIKTPPMQERVHIPKGKGETILIVEDDTAVRDLIVKILHELNYNVIAAVNGNDAVNIFARYVHDIRLVLTDVVMPEMDGIELSRLLIKQKPSLRVVALSGYPLRISHEDLQKAGVVEWLQKPVQLQTLAKTISRALEKGYNYIATH